MIRKEGAAFLVQLPTDSENNLTNDVTTAAFGQHHQEPSQSTDCIKTLSASSKLLTKYILSTNYLISLIYKPSLLFRQECISKFNFR